MEGRVRPSDRRWWPIETRWPSSRWSSREIAALLRNTCSITMLQGSGKINVVPPEAQAQVDCRLLPDQDHSAFLREFATALNDADIKVETIIDFTPAVSPTDNLLYNAIVSGHSPAFSGWQHCAVGRDGIHRQPLVPGSRHRVVRVRAISGARSRRVGCPRQQRAIVSRQRATRHADDARDRESGDQRGDAGCETLEERWVLDAGDQLEASLMHPAPLTFAVYVQRLASLYLIAK